MRLDAAAAEGVDQAQPAQEFLSPGRIGRVAEAVELLAQLDCSSGVEVDMLQSLFQGAAPVSA